MIEWGDCYYSELIDGVLFCHYLVEDVLMDGCCDNFVNYARLKEIFEDVIRDYLGL